MNQTIQTQIPSVGYNNTDYRGWEVAKAIAKIIRSEGIRMQVVKADGTTSPSGSRRARNWIEASKEWFGGENAELGISYVAEDGQRIKEILDKHNIPYLNKGIPTYKFTFIVKKDESWVQEGYESI